MDTDGLIERASRESGLPSHGAESARPALAVLLPEIERSQTLRPGALAGIEAYIVDTLIARFRIDDWIARHPELAERPVDRPLFILGMPRAGTTLLVNLLRFDPRRRMYWHWEGNREVPPAQAAHLHDDPRIARRVAEIEAGIASGALDPRHHVEGGDEPTECIWTLGQDFKAYPWLVQTQVPAYFEWLMHEADMTAAYRHHKRALQVMQANTSGGWTLKLPSHAASIDALLAVYPDARILATHRDPARPIGSSCSACDHILLQNNSSIDRALLGRETAKLLALSAKRLDAARDAHPEVPFLDFHYHAFVADPLGHIERLYAFLGEDLPPAILARMEQALAHYRIQREAHGEHRYRIEDYGLTRADLTPMFSDYVDRHAIAREGD